MQGTFRVVFKLLRYAADLLFYVFQVLLQLQKKYPQPHVCNIICCSYMLFVQATEQPYKIIDELQEGETKFKAIFMVVGKELCNPNWKPEANKIHRPPGHLKLRDKNNKYIMLTVWASLWKRVAQTDFQQMEYANRFMSSFLLGGTYEFSFLCTRELVRQE